MKGGEVGEERRREEQGGWQGGEGEKRKKEGNKIFAAGKMKWYECVSTERGFH